MNKIAVFWFRRDLRLFDNCGLFHALQSNKPVLPLFIFDLNITHKLSKNNTRINFIYNELNRINNELLLHDSSLHICNETPLNAFKQLIKKYTIECVYTNHDYEPYAIKRDQEIKTFLRTLNIAFKSFKDQVIFEKDEIIKNNGTPYKVFTPYSKKW